MARRPPGDRNSDAIDDEELHFYQSPTHSMEVAGEELDNQQAVLGTEAYVPAPGIDDSVERADHESTAHAQAASNSIMNMEYAGCASRIRERRRSMKE